MINVNNDPEKTAELRKRAEEITKEKAARLPGVKLPFRPVFFGKWGVWIVLLSSLLTTFFGWYSVRTVTIKRAIDRFDFQVKTLELAIRERLQTYEFLLQSGAGLFAASDEVSRKEWRTFVTMMQVRKYYPGIQGIGFSKRILSSEKETHIRQIRDEGFPDYTIRPEGERPEYTSIIFLEPFDWRNQRAFGYDMFSGSVRKEAMSRARDTGLTALSGRVTLVQETDKDVQPGFLMYVPVYRNGAPRETLEQRREALTGYVYSPFRTNDFMKGVLAEKQGYVELHIFDGDKPLEETLLFRDNTGEEASYQPNRTHFATRQYILEYAGHRWLLLFDSSAFFEETIEDGSANATLFLGIIISLLLSAVILFLTRSRNQAVSLANMSLDMERGIIELRKEVVERKRAEEALRESDTRLRFALRACHIGAWDLDLVDHTASRTIEHDRIFGYAELLPQWTLEMFLQHVLPEYRVGAEAILREATTAKAGWSYECRIRRADGETRWIWFSGRRQTDNSGHSRVGGIVQDITDRKLAEAALQESELRFRTMANAIPQLAWIARADGHILWYNQRWYDYTGTIPEQMEGWGWQSVHDPNELPKVLKRWQYSIATGEPFDMTFPLRGADGVFHPFLTRVIPLKDTAGRAQQWFGTNTDVSELKRVEQSLRESEALYRGIGESIDYGVWICAPDGRNKYASDSFLKLVGMTQEQCSNFGWGDVLHPDDAERTLAAWQECVRTGDKWDIEHRFRGMDGQWHPVLARGVPVRNEQGEITRWAGINLDISRIKQAEEQIKASLAEKEVLLKEVHHRVKNNLAAIMGLLDLQGQKVDDATAKAALVELSGRIRSMALVHEQLYKSENFSRINFQDYTQALITHLSLSYERSVNFRVSVAAKDIVMGIDSAVPCGLLMTELVTNAFKYAFPEGRPRPGADICEIAVSAEWDGAAYTLTVADNGVGLPVDLDWSNTDTMGLLLVKMLGEHQLQGRIELDRSCGTSFRLRFEPRTNGE